jgi:hypothetical protein
MWQVRALPWVRAHADEVCDSERLTTVERTYAQVAYRALAMTAADYCASRLDTSSLYAGFLVDRRTGRSSPSGTGTGDAGGRAGIDVVATTGVSARAHAAAVAALPADVRAGWAVVVRQMQAAAARLGAPGSRCLV